MKIRTLLTQFVLLMLCWQSQFAVAAATSIADQPLFATNNVPPNMMLALSVEWPTGVVAAYTSSYSANTTYLGYFDPARCYNYYKASGATAYNTPDTPLSNGRTASSAATEYFKNSGAANNHVCSNSFSGNFLNWAAMHALDGFRFAMTGGDRIIDTTTQTVIEKTRHNGKGGYAQFPVKSKSSASTISPFAWNTIYTRVTNDTTELNLFSDSATRGRFIQISNNSSFSSSGNNNFTYSYLVRVEVCASSNNLEYAGTDYAMCEGYPVNSANPTVYKPVGIIQRNAAKMRFGVTAYLFDSNSSRAGGVVRARMKSVGPSYASTTTTNPYAEWSEATGVYVTHPDAGMLTSAELNSTAAVVSERVTQSGVINYINKFGKTNGYKEYDPFSELYYAALRSLRNMTPSVSNYTSNLTSAMYDGFPIILTAADEADENLRPIQYYCQQSNIVGLADSNCHTDVDVPGNTLNGYSGHPKNGVADDSMDVSVLEAALNTKENTNKFTGFAGGRNNTYHVSALSYWANSTDILPDNNAKSWTKNTQNVKSYFIDVQESGSDGNSTFDANGVPTVKNQMFYAAKYGGADFNSAGAAISWGNANGFPNNLFYGSSPALMIASLKSIVNSALARSLSAAGTNLSGNNFVTNNTSASAYAVTYNSKYWTGDVQGNLVTMNSAGEPTTTAKWSAQSLLDTLVAGTGWDTNRKVVTYNPASTSALKGIPFRYASLNSTQQTYFGATSTSQQNAINYLRGERTNEGTLFRTRQNVLGDIIDSEAVSVGAPAATYSADTGFGTFKTTYATRKKMVYVGANDGMLHAIDGDVGTTTTSPSNTAGKELWAYVPSFVLSGPSATPATDGLLARTALSNFSHKYYVNQTPVVRDVDFLNTRNNKATDGSSDWRTILVGGLGKGGKGYYCLDITAPTSWTSETAVAQKVLWEFTDSDMGFSYGTPIIAKTARDGWVVILSSGYNNTTGSNPGKGYLYIVNAKTGALIQKISTDTGSSSNPSGFAHPVAFLPSNASYTVDFVYGGDLLGNLWRFDLRSSTATTYDAPTLIATLKDASGNIQPITTAPKVEIGSNGVRRWVFVGTGQLLGNSDLTNTQAQTFYAIRDGSKTSVYRNEADEDATKTVLPAIVEDFPITRTNMVAITDLTRGYTADANKPMGWYYDMAASERVTVELAANEGIIAWASNIPDTSDPCSPGGKSYRYAVEYDTGKTRLTNEDGTLLSRSESDTPTTKLQFVKDSSGKIRLLGSTSDNDPPLEPLKGSFGRASGKAIRLSWRELAN